MRLAPTLVLIASLAGILPLTAAFGIWYILSGLTGLVPDGPLVVGIGAGLAMVGVVVVGAILVGRSVDRARSPLRTDENQPNEMAALVRLGRALAANRHDLRGPPLRRFIAFAVPAQPRRVPVPINDAIDVCVAALQAGGERPRKTADVTFDPDPNVGCARLDPDQFHQVVLNLILNARDAAGPSGHVNVRTQQLEGIALVAVRDDGAGVPPDRMKTLLQPFRSTSPGALGLGLATCRQIVEAHGGRLLMANILPHGLEVGVELPLMNRGEEV